MPDSSSQAPLNDDEGGFGMAVRLPRYARNDGGMWKDLEDTSSECLCHSPSPQGEGKVGVEMQAFVLRTFPLTGESPRGEGRESDSNVRRGKRKNWEKSLSQLR